VLPGKEFRMTGTLGGGGQPGDRAVRGVGLRPLTCWDCGFESRRGYNNNNNNNIYLLQLGCHPVAVVILHVNKT